MSVLMCMKNKCTNVKLKDERSTSWKFRSTTPCIRIQYVRRVWQEHCGFYKGTRMFLQNSAKVVYSKSNLKYSRKNSYSVTIWANPHNSRSTTVSLGTRLQTREPKSGGLIPRRDKNFYFLRGIQSTMEPVKSPIGT